MRRVAIALVVSITLGIVVFEAAAASRSLPCERAAAWVKAHPGSLPRTLGEVEAFPIEYRRAIFDALSPADRAALWREQLRRIGARPGITNEQRAVIDLALSLATAENYGNQQRPRPELREQILRAFPDRRARQAFGELGSTQPTYSTVAANVVRVREFLVASATVLAQGEVQIQCACQLGDDWCWSGTCKSAKCEKGGHCGTLWWDPCDGMCQDSAQ